jgi:hypothetical protein
MSTDFDSDLEERIVELNGFRRRCGGAVSLNEAWRLIRARSRKMFSWRRVEPLWGRERTYLC